MTSLTSAKLLWASTLLFLDFLITPTFSIFGIMLGAIMLDFVTGIIKAKFKKINRTSEGYRKTMIKLMQYLVPVLILSIAGRFIPEYTQLLKKASGWIMMFITYIEVTSIFENLYEIDKTSPISRYLYKNALIILKFGLEKNAVAAAADKIKDENKTTEAPPKP